MKKLISLLTISVLTSTTATTVLACAHVPVNSTPPSGPEANVNKAIANEIIRLLKKENFEFSSPDNSPIPKGKIKDAIVEKIPNKIAIDGVDTSTYDKQQSAVDLTDDLAEYPVGTKITVYISYKNQKSSNLFNIQIKSSNPDEVNSNKVSNWVRNNETILVTGNNIGKNVVLATVTNILYRDLQLSKNYSISELNSQFIAINKTTPGELTFKIINSDNGKFLKNINDNTDSFKIKFNNEELKKYLILKSKLDEFNAQAEPSLSLRTIKLINFIPNSAIENFPKKEEVSQLLNKITLGDFVDWFFKPDGKYAKLMPRTMPILKDNRIDEDRNGPNKELWNYIDTIKDDLLSQDIDALNGDLSSSFDTTMNGWPTNISFDLYNIIKNITPDLIHFHNYLINNSKKATNSEDKNNYLLLFIRYLRDEVKDYKISDNLNDNFSQINRNIKGRKIKNNFNSLLHNLLDPFQGWNINDVQQDSGINPLNIVVTAAWVIKNNIRWENMSYQEDPYEVLFTKLLNQILAPVAGQNVTKPIDFETKVSVFFFGQEWLHWTETIKGSIDFSDLHIMELKNLFKYNFGLNSSFENATYDVKDGRLFLEAYKNNQWIKIHSLDDGLESTNIRFKFENIKFSVDSENDKNVGLDYTLKNFYLTL